MTEHSKEHKEVAEALKAVGTIDLALRLLSLTRIVQSIGHPGAFCAFAEAALIDLELTDRKVGHPRFLESDFGLETWAKLKREFESLTSRAQDESLPEGEREEAREEFAHVEMHMKDLRLILDERTVH